MSTTAGGVSVGIDLGGTSVRLGIYDVDMSLCASRTMPTRVSAGPESVVVEIAEAIAALLQPQQLGTRCSRPIGIGIGSPGPINLRDGILGLLPNLPGWERFPLRDALATATGLPVVLESDANAAALGEWKLGAGSSLGFDSMAMITLGTGVGSGLILRGRMWHGICGMGGEVGHVSIHPDGPSCPCGSRGCLELYASANGIIRATRLVSASATSSLALRQLVAAGSITPLAVAELADGGDSAAQDIYRNLGRDLGIGIAGLLNTLDLPLIVVGGGVASAWPLFAPAMFESLRSYSLIYRLAEPSQTATGEPDCPFICPALLGSSAGLLGAALLPRLAQGDTMIAMDHTHSAPFTPVEATR